MRQFGELEAVVMDRLWGWGRPALVREMVEDLRRDRPLAYTTVMTVMENLHRKGWLRRERDGRAWRYEPTSSRSAYTAALMNDALGTSTDRRTALAHFVLQMSPHDVKLLQQALDQGARPGAEPSGRRRLPVTIAAVLLAYAVGVGTLGAGMLARAGWTVRAPLLAILTYLAAAWSVVAALALAGLTLAVHATALGGALSQLIGACVLRLRATYATPGGMAAAGAGLILTGAVAGRTGVTAARHLRLTRRQALRHARTARLVGRPEPALGAVLVEHSQPAAYCVAGRHPTVILTTAALRVLAPGQLEAVMAHERAHLTWRHHRLVAMARISCRALPFLPLMRDAEAQVERLVELHADDAAVQARDPNSLATALVVMATADAAAPAPGPAADAAAPALGLAAANAAASTTVLASAATDVAQRIHRLLRPAKPLGRSRRLLLRAMATGLVLGPLIMALAPAVLALALGRVPHP